ncbi:ceramidase domain-containing protein [bacterium]|nr:ceramidase domain-containing protein [bacterium]
MSLYDGKPIPISIEPQCPWYDGQVTYGTPNVDWCEPTVCAWINEPANTWSNLLFLLVGLLLWRKIKNSLVQSFGLIVFLMGSLSGVYHATNNLLTQHFDFLGIVLMSSFLLAFVSRRIRQRKQNAFDQYFWFFLSLNLLILLFLGVLKLPLQLMMFINMIPVFLAEMYCIFVLKKTRKMYFFFASFTVLIVAQVFSLIDLKRIYCEPSNMILHGHVIWHFLCAVSMGFVGLHIRENS